MAEARLHALRSPGLCLLLAYTTGLCFTAALGHSAALGHLPALRTLHPSSAKRTRDVGLEQRTLDPVVARRWTSNCRTSTRWVRWARARVVPYVNCEKLLALRLTSLETASCADPKWRITMPLPPLTASIAYHATMPHFQDFLIPVASSLQYGTHT